MGKNDYQYGGWNSYTLQCGPIMTLISPGDCTLQCGMWLWNHDSEFTKWQHPANVIRGSGMTCHWICPVVAPCSVTCSSGIMTLNLAGGSTLQYVRWLWDDMPLNLEFYIWFRFQPHHRSRRHSAPISEILSKSDHPRQKKWHHVDFQDGGFQPSWILWVQ